jgi:hypothetical protein
MVRYNLSGTYHQVCIPYRSQQYKQIAAGSKCINFVKLRRLSAEESHIHGQKEGKKMSRKE